MLEIVFRTVAMSEIPLALSDLLDSLCDADPDFYLWHGIPVKLDELTGKHEMSLKTTPASVEAFMKGRSMSPRTRVVLIRRYSAAIFRNCKDILARRFCRPAEAFAAGLGTNASLHFDKQKLDKTLIYRLLGTMLTSMRDQLDLLKRDLLQTYKFEQYSQICNRIVGTLREELGQYYANESVLPQLRLLAGVGN